MAARRMHLLETPTGTGKVYKKEDWLAEARYSLTVEQEILVIESESGTEEVPGLISTHGRIEILSGERDLLVTNHGPYVLQLGNGRTWDFQVAPWDPKSGTYQVVDASARSLESVQDEETNAV